MSGPSRRDRDAPELPPRPRPVPTSDSRSFWEATARGELELQHCRRCGAYIFYPRPCCGSCGSADLETRPACGRGTLYTYTVARRPTHPALAARVPYVIAMVELEEGPRLTTNLVECPIDDVRIGMPVELCFEALDPSGEGIALPLFRPAR